ncbi:MAG: SPOR domain-containing protein [Sulfitobacter sp.]
MLLNRFIFGCIIVLSLAVAVVAQTAEAQTLRRDQGPKEYPPSSYAGKQYIDSAGCAYIRAGIDGLVTWVPRVSRDRKVLCGFEPSLAGPVAAAAPKQPPATDLVEIKPDGTDAAPAKKTTAQAARVAPTKKPVRRRTVRAAQPAGIVYETSTIDGAVQGTISGATRVLPKHVYIARQNTGTIKTPKGYAPVWEDDRLNPRRAEQSLTGIAQTKLVWTSTVPRRLVDQSTGQDLTAKIALVYPYTDAATQRRELGKVTIVRIDGKLAKRVVRNRRAAQPVISSRSKPAAPAKVSIANGRYVQIGTYARTANMRATVARIQKVGLPVKVRKFTRGGKAYQTLVTGPFGSDRDLRTALSRVQAAGYADAFVRK